MNVKFTVGEFAKLHGLKKQTLIFYDNIGLFKPKIVDKTNGYRYYTSDQLEILDSILILREIGIPINDIKQFLDDRNNLKTLKLLKEQKLKLKEQVKNLKRTIMRLENKIETIENLRVLEKSVSFEQMNLEYLAIEKVDTPYQFLQTDIAFKKLLNLVTEKKYPYNYQLGVMIPPKNLENKEYTSSEFVFFPLYKKLKDKNIIEKKEGLYAITYHKGAYTQIGNTYEYLLSEIKKHNYKIIGHSYEYCILDSLTSSTQKDYITKITIPIESI